MRKTVFFISVTSAAIMLLFSFCRKEKGTSNDCFPGAITYRTVIDQPAIVKQAGGVFFLVEQGSIDSKLVPCNLPADFQFDLLPVTISGDVKTTVQGGPGPCCTEYFVIKKIKR